MATTLPEPMQDVASPLGRTDIHRGINSVLAEEIPKPRDALWSAVAFEWNEKASPPGEPAGQARRRLAKRSGDTALDGGAGLGGRRGDAFEILRTASVGRESLPSAGPKSLPASKAVSTLRSATALQMASRLFAAALLFASAIAAPKRQDAASTSKQDAATPLTFPAGHKPGFKLLMPAQTGVTFRNTLADEAGAKNRNLYNGSGVALGDFDGDGKIDLFFCSLEGGSQLYRNLGNWKFEDVTAKAGVQVKGAARAATFADVDGDGKLDLLVSVMGEGVTIFHNEGAGKFSADRVQLASKFSVMSLALADIDGDGDLDLYVATHRVQDYRDSAELTLAKDEKGNLVIPPEKQDRFVIDANGALQEYGEPDTLYLNDGKGHFTAASWTDGTFLDADGKKLTGPPLDWGLCAIFHDANGDGAPDLYVCNDYWTPDRFYFNDGKGHFREVPRLAMRNSCASSMGVDFADVNRDGYVDFMAVDMLSREHQRRKQQMGAMKPTPVAIGQVETRPQVMRNTLYLNRGDNTWAEVAYLAGVHASEWSWQPLFVDVDLDGMPDLLISSGNARDVQDADTSNEIAALKKEDQLISKTLHLPNGPDLSKQDKFSAELLAMAKLRPRLDTPIVAFHNKGDLTFEEVDWGTGALGVHHGIALADLDGDGDLDLVVNNLYEPAGIYRNEGSEPRVAVELVGAAPNPQGIGALVTLKSQPFNQTQEVIAGGRYGSGCGTSVCFASSEEKMVLEVRWRSGKFSQVQNVQANRKYTIAETTSAPGPADESLRPQRLFSDITSRLQHTHHENAFDDFQRQSLLPNRLSQGGPGVAFADINDDGQDELLVGSGAGGGAGVLSFRAAKGAVDVKETQLGKETPRDQTGIVTFSPKAGVVRVLTGLSNFEDGKAVGDALGVTVLTGGKGADAPGIAAWESHVGPVCLGDANGDGRLDVFLGGRSIPGKYPAPAASRLYLGEPDGSFVADEKFNHENEKLGLVSDAVFADLNGDGWPDLALAMEWGLVRVLLNDGQGHFTDATASLGLAKDSGWWNGITAGDLDGDGRLDLVVTNWGRNSKYEHHYDSTHPLLAYYGDFNGDGVTQIVEAHFDHQMNKLVPERGLSCSSRAMPFIKTVAPTYTQYGGSGLKELYRDKLDDAPSVRATMLDSSIFLNRGDHFERRSLPITAQVAPAFGCVVQDFDGDGHEDVFIADNFAAAQIETPRMDGGRSLLLLGDGKGELTPMAGQFSGIAAYGDGRGAATGDFDRDGRADLLVGQNGWKTHLFHNDRAKPGLRIRLAGADGNRDGIGAQVRVIFAKDKAPAPAPELRGPVKEIRSGGGYWSQDSHTLVMGLGPHTPSAVWVRWPGGRETTTPVEAGAKEVVIGIDGKAVK